MQDKIDDLEWMLDIKMNEVEYYKGELERAGIESNYEDSVVSETSWTDYYNMYMKEKDTFTKVTTVEECDATGDATRTERRAYKNISSFIP